MAELVDALDLGSSDFCRVGSSPSARTMICMKIIENKKTDLDVDWDVTIPANLINMELNKKYGEISSNVNLPGFRPGKVPLNIVKKRYSKSVIPEVVDTIVNSFLREEVSKRKLKPSVQPKVDIKKFEEGSDLIFNVKFQLMPEIPEITLKEIKIEKSLLKISDNDIQNTLKEIADKHERFIPLNKDRKSKKTDLILFDYSGTINGKKFSGSTGKDETVVLGSGKYIPGYEDQMENMGKGESREIQVVFPEDYREAKLAKKKAKFQITVKDIQEKVKKIPIDDKLASEVGEKDLDSLKIKITERMKSDFEKLSNLKMRREATEKLLKKINFKIPSRMIDDELNFLKNQSKDKKNEELDKLAQRRVKLGLIINAISEKNNIQVEDSDLTKAVVDEAKKYPGKEKEVVEFYKKNTAMINNLKGIALEEKVMSFVINSCSKTNKECNIDDLFGSEFLKEEKNVISKKDKEKKK